MRVSAFLLLLSVCCYPILAHGGALREIELADGSVVRAEVVSMNNGIYRLRSETLGEIEVPESRVRAIRSPGAQAARPQISPEPEASEYSPATAAPAPAPSGDDLQQALTNDPAAMEKILSLQNDPLMQSILSDESTMEAVQAGDLGTLLNDPKIRALMNHPTVRELSDQYGR
jgi:hypothetical protein